MTLEITIRWEMLLQMIAIIPFIIYIIGIIVLVNMRDNNYLVKCICNWGMLFTSVISFMLYLGVAIIRAWQHTLTYIQIANMLLLIWFIVIIISAYRLGDN